MRLVIPITCAHYLEVVQPGLDERPLWVRKSQSRLSLNFLVDLSVGHPNAGYPLSIMAAAPETGLPMTTNL